MPHVSSTVTWYLFAPLMQVVVPHIHVLQDVVLNCTSNTSCGTKSVYDSIAGGSACSFASRSSARARWPPAHTRRTNIKYQPAEQARHTWPAS
jgi:hypothetical protein